MKKKIINFTRQLDEFDIFLILSPIIDLFGNIYIGKNTQIPFTISAFLRLAFIIYILILLSFNKQNYKKHFIFLLLVIIELIGNLTINTAFNDKNIFFNTFKNFFKVWYAPLLIFSMLTLRKKEDVKKEKNILKTIIIIYIFTIFMPYAFGNSFNSYSNGKTGMVGLYYAPNEVGAILAILSPFVVKEFIINNTKLNYIIVILFICICMMLGTKVPSLAIILSISLHIIYMFINNKNSTTSKNIIPLLSLLAFSILLFNYGSPKNNILYQYSKYESTENELEESQNSSLISNKRFDDNKYINIIFSSRNIYIFESVNHFIKNANIGNILFGYNNIMDHSIYYLTEIDYYDILHNYGILGFTLYFCYVLLYLLKYCVNYIIRFIKKKAIMIDDFTYFIIFSLILGISLFAGHVFTAPSVSSLCSYLISNCIFQNIEMFKKKC